MSQESSVLQLEIFLKSSSQRQRTSIGLLDATMGRTERVGFAADGRCNAGPNDLGEEL